MVSDGRRPPVESLLILFSWKKDPGEGPGEMALVYYPNYPGGGDPEDPSSKPILGKKVIETPPISTNTPGMTVHAYDPSYEAAQR
jgi:hypothetical protein